ncbi:hypothetical protein [Neoasaia chiangmaiensis]|nr:hypothetical protein [Neoasaia chiangmaiensis]
MQGGLKPQLDSIKQFSETDFTEDLQRIDVPTADEDRSPCFDDNPDGQENTLPRPSRVRDSGGNYAGL